MHNYPAYLMELMKAVSLIVWQIFLNVGLYLLDYLKLIEDYLLKIDANGASF